MRRTVRLTERDLTRLVKKTIMELDRSTYDRAADVAGEKGYNKLSDRFREHGKEFGLNQGKTEILMVADMGGGNTGTYRIRITNIKDVSHYDIDSDDVEITLKTEDMVVGEEKTIMINKRSDKLKIYMPGIQSMALPKTRKDANKLTGRTVVWVSGSGKELKGVITRAHGNNGAVRALFKKAGLPGQALGTRIKIIK